MQTSWCVCVYWLAYLRSIKCSPLDASGIPVPLQHPFLEAVSVSVPRLIGAACRERGKGGEGRGGVGKRWKGMGRHGEWKVGGGEGRWG